MNRLNRFAGHSISVILRLMLLVGLIVLAFAAQAGSTVPAAATGFQCPWNDCRTCAQYQKACLGVETPASHSGKPQQLNNHAPQSWISQMTEADSTPVAGGTGSTTTGTMTKTGQSGPQADTGGQSLQASHHQESPVSIPASNPFGLFLAFLGFLLFAAPHARKAMGSRSSSRVMKMEDHPQGLIIENESKNKNHR